ncbi:hypothetical protein [Actomonas aquatica]|uniref:Uncharacterized protein n=1 Tax=Actomonas aquatica TaxID=2866162 RepID=A0ABZ1C2H0_9BACT|nr:hypothetical protein [Opitutus sp. WL0086]WRQ85522.1 hypothetical protein K1X11_011985 [Opitutus sp. WL0086]
MGCAAKYDYVAQTTVEGITVRVGLKHSHPFLAEYKRFLEVEHAGEFEKKEIFPDTGGFAWLVIADNRGALEVTSIGGIEFSEALLASGRKQRDYLGRFDFDAKKVYRFIPSSEDRREPKPPE